MYVCVRIFVCPSGRRRHVDVRHLGVPLAGHLAGFIFSSAIRHSGDPALARRLDGLLLFRLNLRGQARHERVFHVAVAGGKGRMGPTTANGQEEGEGKREGWDGMGWVPEGAVC